MKTMESIDFEAFVIDFNEREFPINKEFIAKLNAIESLYLDDNGDLKKR